MAALSAVAFLFLLSGPVAADALGDRVCDYESFPLAFGAVGEAPTVETWAGPTQDLSQRAAECFAGASAAPGLLVTVTGSFRSLENVDGLLDRFGAVARLLTVRYWSVTDHAWRPLVASAAAITSASSRQPRGGFTAVELQAGRDVYLAQQDSRAASEAVYRMRVRDSSRDRFVLETENLTPLRWWGIMLFPPGAIRSAYLLERRQEGIWSYHSVTKITGSSWLISGHEKSYVNRIVALYRHLADIPTDLEPPAAP